MKLFTFKGNTHALQSLIIARYNGIDIEVRRKPLNACAPPHARAGATPLATVGFGSADSDVCWLRNPITQVPDFEMGKDNKSKAFLAMSPLGKVPVLETAEGPISEAAAIARCVHLRRRARSARMPTP